MKSVFKITTPANTTLTTSGGDTDDLISTKCSFYNSFTFNMVIANESFASLTCSDAILATSLASLACYVAIASSFDTIF